MDHTPISAADNATNSTKLTTILNVYYYYHRHYNNYNYKKKDQNSAAMKTGTTAARSQCYTLLQKLQFWFKKQVDMNKYEKEISQQ